MTQNMQDPIGPATDRVLLPQLCRLQPPSKRRGDVFNRLVRYTAAHRGELVEEKHMDYGDKVRKVRDEQKL